MSDSACRFSGHERGVPKDLVPDVAEEVAKGWEYELSWNRRSLIERYAEGRYDLHVHRRVRWGHGEANEVCILLNRPGGALIRKADLALRRARLSSQGYETPLGDMEEAVLVDVRQVMQHPERFTRRGLPCMVRLQAFDGSLGGGGESSNLESPAARTRGAVLRTVFENGELRVVRSGRSVAVSDLPSELIERRTKRIEKATNEEADQRWWLVEDRDPKSALAGCEVYITRDGVRVCDSERADAS